MHPREHQNKRVTFQDWGRMDYKAAWERQESLMAQVIQAKQGAHYPTPNYLVFCEHPHVFTLGKSGKEEHLLAQNPMLQKIGATYYKINRGGDITYHGPGQLVGYPILDLENFFTDIHEYLRLLEEAVILTLDEYGIKGGRIKGLTGVWLDHEIPARARKICAMGVRCSRWVTMHGFAFNLNTQLQYFDHIIPCGIKDKAVTSMERELGQPVDAEAIKLILKGHIARLFGMELVEAEKNGSKPASTQDPAIAQPAKEA